MGELPGMKDCFGWGKCCMGGRMLGGLLKGRCGIQGCAAERRGRQGAAGKVRPRGRQEDAWVKGARCMGRDESKAGPGT